MDILAHFIFSLFLYGTAKVILPLFTFGKCYADQEKSKAGWLSGWPYCSKGKDGKYYFSLEGSCIVAFIFWGLVFIIVATILK